MIFDSLDDLVHVVVVGLLAYVALVLLLRVSGKRTLGKLNAFDLVVTVALGSTLASMLVSTSVSLADGLLAIALLVGLQYAVTSVSVRVAAVARLVRAAPTLLVLDGELQEQAMQDVRVTRSDVFQSIRSSGVGGLDLVAAVVLETDGTLSVITSEQAGDRDALDSFTERTSTRGPRTTPE